MNFKNMSVLFILILFPIILVFILYASLQSSSLNMQTQYDSKLSVATYDAMTAFNINTINNDKNSALADSLIRDINASINTFMSTLSLGFGSSGQDSNNLKPYIPALVYTLYDGYYIYSPSVNSSNNDKYEHILKPYIYYTARYTTGTKDIVINYTLDNYISYYGYIGGKSTSDNYVTGAGYLEPLEHIKINNVRPASFASINPDDVDLLSVKYKDVEITEREAKLYYINAGKFTEIATADQVLGSLLDGSVAEIGKTSDDVPEEFKNRTNTVFKISTSNDPNDEESNFNFHRKGIIKTSIQNNLNAAMASYSKYGTVNYTFQMPVIPETEWDTILSNVSILSFMQGIPIGMKMYNGYSFVTNTNNKHFTAENTVYYISSDDETVYHRLDCSHLSDNGITGHKSYLFEKILDERVSPATYRYITGDDKDDRDIKYPIDYGQTTACYYCIVNSNYAHQTLSPAKLKAKYTVLRERKICPY